MSTERDPSHAGPADAAFDPSELPTAADDQIRDQLDELGPAEGEQTPDEIDAEIEREGLTVQPHSAAPSRSGITGSGSGADDEGL